MSAVIIPLPGAAPAPIVQARRRGRYPKGVVGIWTLRVERRDRERRTTALEEEARRLRATAARMPEYMNVALEHAALLEAEARALGGLHRR